uniref:ATP synthase complex subunit 8 n=1 Tax=Ilyobius sp. TaxID=2901399 RepID=A0A8K1TA89_9NEOP|nr:ATP synthase F0 subunit 8 [Ilyobius sp.]
MPQMAPLYWLFLFIFFFMLFILFNIMNYYNYNPLLPNKMNYSSKNLSLIWKW